MKIRHMFKADVPAVLDCEKRHEYEDPDFGVPQLENYAWDEGRLKAAIRQYKKEGTHDTRGLVADEDGKVLGGLVFEMRPEGYEILFLTSHSESVATELLDEVLTRASASKNRRAVSMHVPDGDWKNLKLFQARGFSRRLVPDHYPMGRDAWLCELALPPSEQAG